MAAKRASQIGSTSRLEPEQVTDPETLLRGLSRPVPQLDGPPNWEIECPTFNSTKAKQLLEEADKDPTFRQRPAYVHSIRRIQRLMRTERFVNFLPAGPICFDEAGIMLNGKNRMMALAGLEDDEFEFGFFVIRGLPRWMFAFFDTNRVRTFKDVLHISNRTYKPNTPSAVALAMRYEEFIKGIKPSGGWRHWAAERDEHIDADDFFARRLDLQDWYTTADKIYRLAKISHPAVMVFRFYQGLAWPDGDEMITEFLDTLVTKKPIANNNAAIRLRDWTRDAFYNKDSIPAKRELHLLLLFRTFAQYSRDAGIGSITYAYGQPMTMPFHPDGHDVALTNVKKALSEMDDAAGYVD